MTPKELRENARRKLESAKVLLANKQYDDSSYLAGYGVELALKARYCTRNKLPKFPKNRDEAKTLGIGKVLIHDLEKLISLSDTEKLQRHSMQSIDWDKAMDWDAEQRYHSCGTVTPERAAAQVRETECLIEELEMFEIVETAATVELTLSKEEGPFCLFVVAHNLTQAAGWEIVMSAWWLNTQKKCNEICKRVRAALDADLSTRIMRMGCASPLDNIVQSYQACPTGPIQHALRFFARNNIIATPGNVFIIPPTYVITSVPWEQPQTVGK